MTGVRVLSKTCLAALSGNEQKLRMEGESTASKFQKSVACCKSIDRNQKKLVRTYMANFDTVRWLDKIFPDTNIFGGRSSEHVRYVHIVQVGNLLVFRQHSQHWMQTLKGGKIQTLLLDPFIWTWDRFGCKLVAYGHQKKEKFTQILENFSPRSYCSTRISWKSKYPTVNLSS